jgi:O-antigen ligase
MVVMKTIYFQVLTEVIFFVWLFLAFHKPEYLPKKNPIFFSIIGFLSFSILINLFSIDREVSFFSSIERMDGFFMHLHLAMLYLVWSSTIKPKQWIYFIIISLIVGLICIIYGLKTTNINQNVRLTSTLGNASYLAFYCVCLAFLSFFLLSIESVKKKKIFIVLSYILFFVFVFTLFKTGTRSGLVGLLAGILSYLGFVASSTKNKKSIFLSIFILAMLGGSVYFFKDKIIARQPVFERLFDFSMESTSETRIQVWKTAWEAFKEKPILGWGGGNFNYIFMKFYQLIPVETDTFHDKTHNIFLEWLISGGVVGLFSFIAIFVSSIFVLWKKTNISFTQKAILVSFFISYWVFHFFSFDNLVGLFFIYGAIAFISQSSDYERFTINLSKPAKNIILCLVAFMVGNGMYFINLKIYQVARRGHDILNKNLEISFIQNTYQEAFIGRPQLVFALLSLEAKSSTTNKENYFKCVLALAENELKAHPHEAILPQYMALAYKKIGNLDKAIQQMEVFCRQFPRRPAHWVNYGMMLIEKGEYQKAIHAFDMIAKYQPQSSIGTISKLYVYGNMNDMLMFNQTLHSLSLQRKVEYQDLIAKAFIAFKYYEPYFQYMASFADKKIFNSNSYMYWISIALTANNSIEYRKAWHSYTENMVIKAPLNTAQEEHLNSVLTMAQERLMTVPEILKIIKTFDWKNLK